MDYTWQTVPAPNAAPGVLNHNPNVIWHYPFDLPAPAGTYEVCNAIVDSSQKVGAWSQPKTITLKKGWQLYGGSWNQQPTADECGIAWKLKCIDVEEVADYTNGSEHYLQTSYIINSVSPFSASGPELLPLFEMWQRFQKIDNLLMGGRHTDVAPPPIVVATEIPYETIEVAYCRVTETGETALSQSIVLQKHGTDSADVTQLQINLHEAQPPGSLGNHVYIKKPGGEWRRVPAFNFYGDVPQTPDDWLFQWWDMQPILLRYLDDAPVHEPAANPQSRLHNDIQVPMTAGWANITVPANAEITIYCPIVDEYRVYGQNQWTFGRRIKSADGGKWTIKTQQSQSGHQSWPAIGVYNQTSVWQGVTVDAPNSSAALCYADYSGGQAFGNRFIDCTLTGGEAGMRIDARCTGQQYGHTASEQSFENCYFNGRVGIWLGGNQTANCRFKRTFSVGGNDRRSSALFTNGMSSPVNFTDGFYAECSGAAIIRCLLQSSKININDIWVDQSFRCFLESGHAGFNVRLTGGKLNAWNYYGDRMTMARSIDSGQVISPFIATDLQMQFSNSNTTLQFISPHHYSTALRIEDSVLSEVAAIIEPTYEQEAARNLAIYGGQMPLTKRETMPGFQFPIGSGVVTANCVTGGKPVTNRYDWMAETAP